MLSMEEVYKEHAQTVYRFLLSKTGDGGLSEELTQETFYQAIKSIDRYDGSCKMSTWLCAIAKNQLFVYRKKHPPQETFEELADTVPSAESDYFAAGNKVAVLRHLHGLEEPVREVLYLRLFGDLSFREIGDICGKTENWARVTYYRGREKLRKEMKSDE